MIVKGTQVIGLPVMTLKTGQKIEDVDDVIYDSQENKVKALLVDKGGWFSDAKVILIDSIQNIGKDAVIVQDENAIKKASDVGEKVSHIAKDDTYLTKTKIITDIGTDLGHVTDIFFDDKTGIVTDLEVSEGFIKNMQSGKKKVKVSDIETIGEQATIVKAYTEEKFEQQANQQGVQGAIQGAKNQAPNILDQAKQKVSELGQKTKERTQELTQKAQQKTEEVKQSPQLQTAKDRLIQAKDTTKQNIEQTGQKTSQMPEGIVIKSTREVIIPPKVAQEYTSSGTREGQKKMKKKKLSERQRREK